MKRPMGGCAEHRRGHRSLVVVAVASVLAFAGCTTAVLHGLEEQAANESLGALDRAGIAAEKVVDDGVGAQAAGFALRVARAEANRALEVLRVQGLPRERRHGFAEVYGQPSLIPTSSEERARYLAATAGEIERTLETADGIIGARVHLVPEETDPLALAAQAGDAKPRSAARAAVLLKTARGQAALPVADVQKLVAGSVPGLDPAAVAVVVSAAPEAPGRDLGPLTSVGPLRVTPASRGPLIAVFAVGLAVIALLAAMLLVSLRRRLPPP
jgi:type III secretion protein J